MRPYNYQVEIEVTNENERVGIWWGHKHFKDAYENFIGEVQARQFGSDTAWEVYLYDWEGDIDFWVSDSLFTDYAKEVVKIPFNLYAYTVVRYVDYGGVREKRESWFKSYEEAYNEYLKTVVAARFREPRDWVVRMLSSGSLEPLFQASMGE